MSVIYLRSILLYLDMLDDEVVGVQPLVLGVTLGVLEHVQQELGGLDRPPGQSGIDKL